MTSPGQPSLPDGSTRIAFVCRGSLSDGLGHLTRAATVAAHLTQGGIESRLFVLGDSTAERVLGDFHVDYGVHADEGALISDVDHFRPMTVVFDLIELPASTYKQLTDGRATASLSPVFDHLGRVDASFSRTRYEPNRGLASDPSRHRRGLTYAVVPGHVRPISHSDYVARLYQTPLSVGISMGGADAPNKTLQVLEQLRATSIGCLFWVMLGEGYAHSYEELVETIRRDRRHEIVMAKTTRSMWTVLDRCSLVILAGGVTTYEAAFAGMPSINLLENPEHRFLLRELEEGGAVQSLDGSGSPDSWGAQLRELMDQLERDRDRLFLMHRRARGLIDGRGADRIASELLSLTAPRG